MMALVMFMMLLLVAAMVTEEEETDEDADAEVALLLLLLLLLLLNLHDAVSSAKHWRTPTHSPSLAHSTAWHAHWPLTHVGYSFDDRSQVVPSASLHA